MSLPGGSLCHRLSVRGVQTHSLNVRDRMHWAARKKHKAAIYALVMQAGRPSFTVPVDVLYCRAIQLRSKALDDDNMAASAKPVLDALKAAGVIVDDAPEWLRLQCEQRKRAELEADWRLVIVERAT